MLFEFDFKIMEFSYVARMRPPFSSILFAITIFFARCMKNTYTERRVKIISIYRITNVMIEDKK